MSIFIKGMTMPKEAIDIAVYPDGSWCNRENNNNHGSVVEVPKHGRLIDADVLLKTTILNPLSAPYIVRRNVDDAPTVIEAEE